LPSKPEGLGANPEKGGGKNTSLSKKGKKKGAMIGEMGNPRLSRKCHLDKDRKRSAVRDLGPLIGEGRKQSNKKVN